MTEREYREPEVKSNEQYFWFTLESVHLIVAATGSLEAVLAYLVLAKHRQRRPQDQLTTAGRNAIHTHLGVGRVKAGELLSALQKVAWGEQAHEKLVISPAIWQQATGLATPVSWNGHEAWVLPAYGQLECTLPNAVLPRDGISQHLRFHQARSFPRTDALALLQFLLALYQQYSLHSYSGVNPALMCRQWLTLGEDRDWADGGEDQTGFDPRAAYFSVVSRDPQGLNFSDEITQRIAGGDVDRCRKLYSTLRQMNLLYEIPVVFDQDPRNSLDAEPLYPLVCDGRLLNDVASRDLTLYAQAAMQQSSIAGTLDPIMEQAIACGRNASDAYVYAAPEQTAKVLSVVRLSYPPPTQDNDETIEAERTTAWRDWLNGNRQMAECGIE
jgi:hypothetical protein